MTFAEKYRLAKTWHEKAMIVELYHLTGKQRHPGNWTLNETAGYFGISTGLVSESLKLALGIHRNIKLMDIPLRKDALKKL